MTNDAAPQTATGGRSPTVDEFCIHIGLYDARELDSCIETVAMLRFGSFQFDAPCIYCGKSSTFHATPLPFFPKDKIAAARKASAFTRSVKCARDEHYYTYYFRVTQRTVQKVGQFPAMQDIASSDVRRYSPVLSKVGLSELT
jgi:hypothetical protein